MKRCKIGEWSTISISKEVRLALAKTKKEKGFASYDDLLRHAVGLPLLERPTGRPLKKEPEPPKPEEQPPVQENTGG